MAARLMEGSLDANNPQLYVSEGINPSDLFFVGAKK